MSYQLLKKQTVEETMTSKERYAAALRGESVDRLPVGSPTSVATVEQMDEVGASFPEAHYKEDEMFNLAMAAHNILNYDAVMPHFSVWIGGATLGIPVDWGDKDSKMPDGKIIAWEGPDDIKIPSDIAKREPARSLLRVISRIKKEAPDVFVIGKVMGPWTLSYHGYGTDKALMMTVKAPEKLRESLDILKEFTIEFGKLQIEAGADALCIPDHVTGDLVGPETYRKFLLPVHKKLIPEFDEYDIPLILHCCGDTYDRLEYFEEAGWPVYHIESKVDAFDAKRKVHSMKLVGNMNNPTTLWASTPEHVKRESLYAARAGYEALAPECCIPATTPNKNLKAIVEVAKHLKPIKIT